MTRHEPLADTYAHEQAAAAEASTAPGAYDTDRPDPSDLDPGCPRCHHQATCPGCRERVAESRAKGGPLWDALDRACRRANTDDYLRLGHACGEKEDAGGNWEEMFHVDDLLYLAENRIVISCGKLAFGDCLLFFFQVSRCRSGVSASWHKGTRRRGRLWAGRR